MCYRIADIQFVLVAVSSALPAVGLHSIKFVAGIASFQAASSMFPSSFKEAVVRMAGNCRAGLCAAALNTERRMIEKNKKERISLFQW